MIALKVVNKLHKKVLHNLLRQNLASYDHMRIGDTEKFDLNNVLVKRSPYKGKAEPDINSGQRIIKIKY